MAYVGTPMGKSTPVKVCLECRATYRTARTTCPKDNSELVRRDLPVGSILAGKYRIEEEIGRGGMGVVCRGVHMIMGKEVAIKLINPLFSARHDFLRMFRSEARALAAFRHPNVLTVHDFGRDGVHYFMVMELLRGRSLREIMDESGRFPTERAFSILVKICEAVAAAHAKGIIHLDLKGENVIIIGDGSGTDLKVLDFGLARLAGDMAHGAEEGLPWGTVGYMAPEQLRGEPVDEETDVYAIAVLAYQMLTGQLPFKGRGKSEILRSQVEGRIRRWPKLAGLKAIPKKTRRIILAALRPNPARRPQSVLDLRDAFKHARSAIAKAADDFAGSARPAEQGQSLFAKIRSLVVPLRREVSEGPPAPEGMVYVPAAEFIMGSNSRNPDQAPRMKVPLEAFLIDITPVTNRDYARFVEESDHSPPENWLTLSCPPGTGDLPVTGVSWYDAVDYADWAGKRLPSEGEWEHAARGIDGRPFPWGTSWEPTFANWAGNPQFFGKSKLMPVGSFPKDRSPYGCLDMAGNVMEWTSSWYKPYGPTNYKSSDFGEKYKVVRGGSWLSSDRDYLMCSRRGHARPDSRGSIGFRCVKDVIVSNDGNANRREQYQ